MGSLQVKAIVREYPFPMVETSPTALITSGPSNYKSGTMGTNIRGTRIKLVCPRYE